MNPVLFFLMICLLSVAMGSLIVLVSKPYLYDLNFYKKCRKHAINWWIAIGQAICIVAISQYDRCDKEFTQILFLLVIGAIAGVASAILKSIDETVGVAESIQMIAMQLIAPIAVILILFALAGIYYNREEKRNNLKRV
ncbi:MAG: hypothetical protein K5900_03270 [Butyrivibrio sp.]|nr:hypothetical protein [Butyrivibrio sp.]